MTRPPVEKSTFIPNQHVVLTVQRGDGWRTTYTLEAGKSVMIGRSSNCGLQLAGDNLAAIHCMLRMHDGELLLQDWFSSSGTLVNGEPAHGEMRLPSGATIQVGDYILRAEIHRADRLSTSASVSPAPVPAPVSAPAPVQVAPTAPPEMAVTTVAPDLKIENVDLRAKLNAANEENKMLRQQLQNLLTQSNDHNSGPSDPFAQETIDMLRAEVEQLQSELLHYQNHANTESTAPATQTSDISDGSTQLVERMDELLLELEHSDDRIAALEDLLRVAEEASEAEREERRQLESWVGDIERRIGDRESDWQAEVNGLRSRLADAAEKQRNMEQRLAAAASASTDDRARVQMETWQARVAELQQQLSESEHERESLAAKVREAQQQISDSNSSNQFENALREERVQMAQERAELARARAELVALRAQLQQQIETREVPGNDGDQRMRAFREHLREIHDLEQAQQPNRGGLSARISKLWKRLDG